MTKAWMRSWAQCWRDVGRAWAKHGTPRNTAQECLAFGLDLMPQRFHTSNCLSYSSFTQSQWNCNFGEKVQGFIFHYKHPALLDRYSLLVQGRAHHRWSRLLASLLPWGFLQILPHAGNSWACWSGAQALTDFTWGFEGEFSFISSDINNISAHIKII